MVNAEPETTGLAESPPTIYDIAARAGVSIATVSRVLNGSPSLRPATRDRVLAAIRELDFVPNGAARSLSTRATRVVALVFYKPPGYWPDLTADEEEGLLYTDAVIRGAEHVCQQNGYSLLLSGAGGPRSGAALSRLAALADGLMLMERVIPEDRAGRLGKRVPVVLLAGSGRVRSVGNVHVDNRQPTIDLARHLIRDHGYRDLAFVGEVPGSPDARTRVRTLAATCAALGASCAHGPGWEGDFTAAGGRRVIEGQLAERGTLPRALVCASDQTALGVLAVLAERGLRVPEDVAVTGFDNIPVARHITPPLTTVRQPMRDLGAAGMSALLAILREPGSKPPLTVLPTEVIIRDSCGAHGPDDARKRGRSAGHAARGRRIEQYASVGP
jgi:LacI family transcriptional regulator